MFVTVDRQDGLDVDDRYDDEVTSYLDRYRLAGQDVEIDGPRFVPLDLGVKICVDPDYFRADIRRVVLRELSCARLSDGTLGFFHPDNFTFGQSLYLSRIVARVMAGRGCPLGRRHDV